MNTPDTSDLDPGKRNSRDNRLLDMLQNNELSYTKYLAPNIIIKLNHKLISGWRKQDVLYLASACIILYL